MEGGPHQMAKYQANIRNKSAPIDSTNKQPQAQWTGLGFQKRARKARGMSKAYSYNCVALCLGLVSLSKSSATSTLLCIGMIQSSLKTLRDKTRDNLSELGV